LLPSAICHDWPIFHLRSLTRVEAIAGIHCPPSSLGTPYCVGRPEGTASWAQSPLTAVAGSTTKLCLARYRHGWRVLVLAHSIIWIYLASWRRKCSSKRPTDDAVIKVHSYNCLEFPRIRFGQSSFKGVEIQSGILCHRTIVPVLEIGLDSGRRERPEMIGGRGQRALAYRVFGNYLS
jgi:hypothetical protein